MEEITVKQQAFAIAYIEKPTLKDACEAVGISHPTASKYLKLPAVKEKIQETRSMLFDQSVSRLIMSSDKAISALLAILDDPNARAYAKAAAASTLLSQTVEYYKTYILESQIVEMEGVIEGNVSEYTRRIV